MGINKKITWWEPEFGEEEAKAVYDVVKSGYVNEGKHSEELSNKIKDLLNVNYAVTTPNGTLSLFLALKAVGVGVGDEVIIPGLSFIATASAVMLAGAKPVFADVATYDSNILPDEIEQLISSTTKAIMPVHINGRNADLEEIMKISNKHGIPVVEDAAQALGSKYNGKSLGSIANAGSISLAPTKIITSAQGGLVLTNEKEICETIIKLKDHGRLMRKWNFHPEIGFNFKFNDILAALAVVQLKRLPERLEKAKLDYIQYYEGLGEISEIEFFETNFSNGNIPLWVDIKLKRSREHFIDFMEKINITSRPFWPGIYSQKAYRKYSTRRLKNTDEIASNGLWLPSGPGKRKSDIERVISEIKKYFRKN